MKTLTVTEGEERLGYWLKQAVKGADLGFVFDGQVVALRPVEVTASVRMSHLTGLAAGVSRQEGQFDLRFRGQSR